MKYIVGHSESNFEEQDFIILDAENEQDAIIKFLNLYEIKEVAFIEYVHNHSTNMSFAEYFWFVTEEKNEHLVKTGETLIDKDTFNQRDRNFFKHHSDYADLYISYYWGDKEGYRITLSQYLIANPVLIDNQEVVKTIASGLSDSYSRVRYRYVELLTNNSGIAMNFQSKVEQAAKSDPNENVRLIALDVLRLISMHKD